MVNLDLEIGEEPTEEIEEIEDMIRKIKHLREDLINVCKKHEKEIGFPQVMVGLMWLTIDIHYRLGFSKEKIIKIIEHMYPEE